MNVHTIIASICQAEQQNKERNIPATSPLGMRVEDAVALADHIERLEACVLALDDAMRYATVEEIKAVLDVDRGRVWSKLVATRHRVNLPPSRTSDGAGEGGGNAQA